MLRDFYGKPVAAIVIMVVMMVIGMLRFFELPIALYPNTSKPNVSARVSTGTMSAKEFKERYGKDIENILRAVKDVEKVEADYNNGHVGYGIEFHWGVNADQAKADVKAALDPYNSIFPEHWGNFRVSFEGEFNSEFFVSISSKTVSSFELKEFAKSSIKPRVEAIKGIGAAWIVDFENKNITITLRPEALTKRGLTFDDIRAAIKQKEFDRSLGILSIKDGSNFQVNASTRVMNIDQLRNLIVGGSQGVPIKLRDVANVEFKDEVPENFFKANGQRSLLVGGFAQPDANIKQVADDFMRIIKEETTQISDDIKIETIMSPATFINEAIDNVVSALIMGILITVICVFLFLGSFRDTFIISVSIPLSLVGGFILMDLFGIELNLISLGAMALSVGMVVDGATVVLENILRHFNERKPSTALERIDVTCAAVNEVKIPVIASLMTTIIVFAPLPFTSPLTAAILGDLAIVMVCAMVVSIFVTLFFVPPLFLFLRDSISSRQKQNGIYRLSSGFDRFFRRVQGLYLLSLQKVLLNRRLSWGITVACGLLFLAGIWLLSTQVRREVMARPNTDKLFLSIETQDENLEFEQKEKLVNIYEKEILSTYKEEVSHILSHVGKWGSWIMVILKDKDMIKEMKTKFEERFKNNAYMRFYVGDWVPTSLEIPDPPLLKIVVLGENEEERRNLQQKISFKLQGHDAIGRRNERPSIQKDNYLRVHIDQERLARLVQQSVTEQWIGNVLSSYLNSERVIEIETDGVRQSVTMQMPETFFKTQFDLENLLVRVGEKIVPVKAFAKTESTEEWANYFSVNSKSQNFIELWPKSGNWGDKAFEGDKDELREELKKLILDDKEIDAKRLSFPDTMTEVNENIYSLIFALVFAILLIAVVIVLQFNSIAQTLINLITIPLGFIGVAFSLWMFKSTLSLNSMLGLILLCGTAVNNSIVFIDFYNRLRNERKMEVFEALIETGRLRLTPITITVLTTIVGMLPLAFGFGSGGEILQPLGIAICGGLWMSTLLTIYVVPMIIYSTAELQKSFSFTGLVKKAKILSLFILLLASSLEAKDLSLQEAVTKATTNHPEVKASQSANRVANFEKKSGYSQLLPTVTLKREWQRTSTRYHRSSFPDAPTGVVEDGSVQNMITIEERISNPYRLFNQQRILSLQEDIADSELANKLADITARVRVAYFGVLVAQKLLENAEKSFAVASENFKLSQRRFQGGFIHSSDVKRSELNYLQTKNSIDERKERLSQATRELSYLLGEESKEPLKLSATLPDAFKYFAMEEQSVSALNKASLAKPLQPLQLELESAKIVTHNSGANFFPDLTASATFSKQEPRDEINRYYEQAGPTYLVSAEWQIFSGGRSYFDYKSSYEKAQASEERLRLEEDNLRQRLSAIIGNLLVLKEQHRVGGENVQLTEQILKSSQERFSSGVLNAQQVNDDIRNYLEQQDSFMALKQKIIESLAELAKVTGNSQLFDDWI